MRSHFEGRYHLFRRPSPKEMKSVLTKIRDLTDRQRRRGMKHIREAIRDLGPGLREWGNHYKMGNASDKFQEIDRYVPERPQRLLAPRGGRRKGRPGGRPLRSVNWPHTQVVEDRGLYKLLGMIHIPDWTHAP